MKLGIVTHSVIKGDGQGRVNYEVAKEAIRRGHHVTLLASSVAPDLQQNNLVNWIFIPVKRWPTYLLRNLVFAWQSANWLRKHRAEFDVVKINGAITWQRGDVNAVHFVHSAWLRSPVNQEQPLRDIYSFYQWLYAAWNARWEKKLLRNAKVTVAVSEKVAQELREIGVPPERIRVIVNGVDLQEFFPGCADRQTWNLPDRVPLALFVGDIRTNRKNLDTVLHALVRVPELHLAVAGKTEGSPYPQLAAELNVSDRVHFLGYRHDVGELMRAVDFFVFPSRYEACTLALLEAMASGLPVITATATGGAELVAPNAGIVLKDPNDTSALSFAMEAFAGDRELRNRTGKAARSIAEQYSWATMAQRYVDLFEEFNQL